MSSTKPEFSPSNNDELSQGTATCAFDTVPNELLQRILLFVFYGGNVADMYRNLSLVSTQFAANAQAALLKVPNDLFPKVTVPYASLPGFFSPKLKDPTSLAQTIHSWIVAKQYTLAKAKLSHFRREDVSHFCQSLGNGQEVIEAFDFLNINSTRSMLGFDANAHLACMLLICYLYDHDDFKLPNKEALLRTVAKVMPDFATASPEKRAFHIIENARQMYLSEGFVGGTVLETDAGQRLCDGYLELLRRMYPNNTEIQANNSSCILQ